ncbi:MAG: cation:proton antiporter [Planctomycetota bacterium]
MIEIPETAILVGGTVGLLLIAASTLAITRRLGLPFTVMLVIVGLSLRGLAELDMPVVRYFSQFEISPELIFFVFLPTLIFESALNLDARQLKHNLGSVLMLAVPGLLISTVVIGGLIYLIAGIDFVPACLLGAILSATDPVAVISLFKQLGAPQRLTILVEGESLFNDASSMVVARVLTVVIAAGAVGWSDAGNGVLSFFILFAGGILCGIVMGMLTAWVLGKIESDPLQEITLTTVLAYLSFLVAEELLHVSGVMATVAAGLVLGGWGRYKVSPSVRHFMENFWEYMAFIANALIFLMVGLKIGGSSLWDVRYLLGAAIIAMLISRALVIFGLLPFVHRMLKEKSVTVAYKTVMYWGGLRGAVAIAIVMSLPAASLPQKEIFSTVVMGCVLFTLLIQGLTIKRLMCAFGLDIAPLPDRLGKANTKLQAKWKAVQRIDELKDGGLFLPPVADKLQSSLKEEAGKIETAIHKLSDEELSPEGELDLLYIRAFSEEKALFVELFNKGHLSESAFRELALTVDLQIDRIRHKGDFHAVRWGRFRKQELIQFFIKIADKIPILNTVAEKINRTRVALNYEQSWGHFLSSRRILSLLKEDPALKSDELMKQYKHWHEAAELQMDTMAEQYPEFFAMMQERLGKRLSLLAEEEIADEAAEHGALAKSVAEEIHHEVAEKLRNLRGQELSPLQIEPEELLRKVPCFIDFPQERFKDLASRMHCQTHTGGESVIKQGEVGNSLFLIARGVVRVVREDNNTCTPLATLIAGDFFGENALLHGETRNASVHMTTPGTLYELDRAALDEAIKVYPEIQAALEETDKLRHTS